MNKLIASLAFATLLASSALAQTQAHAPATKGDAPPVPGTEGYTPPVPGDDSATAGYFDGNRLADPDTFVRDQLIRQYENEEP